MCTVICRQNLVVVRMSVLVSLLPEATSDLVTWSWTLESCATTCNLHTCESSRPGHRPACVWMAGCCSTSQKCTLLIIFLETGHSPRSNPILGMASRLVRTCGPGLDPIPPASKWHFRNLRHALFLSLMGHVDRSHVFLWTLDKTCTF